jgi:hypothetical protein
VRAARDLRTDIGRVSGAEPALSVDSVPNAASAVIIGTLGKSPLIDRLVRDRKLDASGSSGNGKRSSFRSWRSHTGRRSGTRDRRQRQARDDLRHLRCVVADRRLALALLGGRPVRRQAALYVLPGRHTQGEPAVKYRGIFINDEAPALSGWTREKFGGFNSKFYEKVFELVLRMKGNYLWPAMWGNAFADDDTLSPKLADEYGIVMGTSHHEPLTRAQAEWRKYGKGAWNYEQNDSVLREFWRGGIRRMGTRENIVTIGMRGDGDEPMTQGTAISLLERIVADQRKIIAERRGRTRAGRHSCGPSIRKCRTTTTRACASPTT